MTNRLLVSPPINFIIKIKYNAHHVQRLNNLRDNNDNEKAVEKYNWKLISCIQIKFNV